MSVVKSDVFPRHKLSVDDYHRMGEAGIFRETDRVELIEGELIDMAPIGSRHAGIVTRLVRLLTRAVDETAIVSVQNPVRLSATSEPQPDFMLLKPCADDYMDQLPTAADVLLLIEVSDTTADYDRRIKLPLYARHGIPEVWLIDINAKGLEQYAEPQVERFQTIQYFEAGAVICPVLLPDVKLSLKDLFQT